MAEKLFFDGLKEHRGSYFVEYQPPVSDHCFATLNLVFPQGADPNALSDLMHTELRHWLSRYPVPLMIWSFDANEDILQPTGTEGNCLVGWIAPSEEIRSSWRIDDLTAFLDANPTRSDWRNIYADVPFRTDAEARTAAKEKWLEWRRHTRILKFIFVLWLAVIPAGIAVFEFLGPEWLGAIALAYSLWKAWRAGMKVLGHAKPSAKEEREAERMRKMEHYFYHCEQNPDGFLRLRVENFKRDAHERTQAEAAELAKLANPKPDAVSGDEEARRRCLI